MFKRVLALGSRTTRTLRRRISVETSAKLHVETVVNANRKLGEGAIWDFNRKALLWVDIVQGKLFIYDPETNTNDMIDVRQTIGTVVPREGHPDHVVAALQRGFAIIDLKEKAVHKFLGNPEEHKYGNRFNDGKCDPQGRFWAGSMGLFAEPDVGSLWCLDTDLSVSEKVSGASICNGICWTQDARTMYWIDTPTCTVDAFDYDPLTGAIDNRRPVVKVREGEFPDGCTLDADGNLWVAMWEGSRVACFDPSDGRELLSIDMPVSQVTSCAFGGADLDQLFITSASVGLSPQQLEREPLAGALFRVDLSSLGVKGVPCELFRG